MSVFIARTVLFLFGYFLTLLVGAPAWAAMLGGWIVAGYIRDDK